MTASMCGRVTERTKVRIADVADLAVITDITERAYSGYLRLLGYPPVPVTENYQPRVEKGEVWMAETDRSPSGLVVVEAHENFSLIFSVAVDPNFHGKGVGRLLLAHAEERAADLGHVEMRLYTNVLMARNLELYARLGYREIGRRPNPKRPEFTIVDMVKPVAARAAHLERREW